MKIISLFFLLFSVTVFCQKNQKFPQEISSVYYQNWVGGQELTGGGTDVYIEFKKPLLTDIKLTAVYFNGHEFKIEKISDTQFIARYSYRPKLVIDQYGNQEIVRETDEIVKPKYILKENDGILEYSKKGKKKIFKLKNIKEKEMIAYP